MLNVSQDLPFALNRFCGAEGIENVKAASAFRSDFIDDYGVRDRRTARCAGLAARSVVVLDADGKVTYTELVPEIAQEPDYDAGPRRARLNRAAASVPPSDRVAGAEHQVALQHDDRHHRQPTARVNVVP